MSEVSRVGAFAIVPSNDLAAAIPFWQRLGFSQTGGDAHYVIMTGWGCEVHLSQAGEGPWRAPEDHNPFGVFIRAPDVDAIAARVEDLIIRPGGVLRHWERACTRLGFVGPTGCLFGLVGPQGCWAEPGSDLTVKRAPTFLLSGRFEILAVMQIGLSSA